MLISLTHHRAPPPLQSIPEELWGRSGQRRLRPPRRRRDVRGCDGGLRQPSGGHQRPAGDPRWRCACSPGRSRVNAVLAAF